MEQTGNVSIQNEITTTSLYNVRSPGVSTAKQALYVSQLHVQSLQVLTVTEFMEYNKKCGPVPWFGT